MVNPQIKSHPGAGWVEFCAMQQPDDGNRCYCAQAPYRQGVAGVNSSGQARLPGTHVQKPSGQGRHGFGVVEVGCQIGKQAVGVCIAQWRHPGSHDSLHVLPLVLGSLHGDNSHNAVAREAVVKHQIAPGSRWENHSHVQSGLNCGRPVFWWTAW